MTFASPIPLPDTPCGGGGGVPLQSNVCGWGGTACIARSPLGTGLELDAGCERSIRLCHDHKCPHLNPHTFHQPVLLTHLGVSVACVIGGAHPVWMVSLTSSNAITSGFLTSWSPETSRDTTRQVNNASMDPTRGSPPRKCNTSCPVRTAPATMPLLRFSSLAVIHPRHYRPAQTLASRVVAPELVRSLYLYTAPPKQVSLAAAVVCCDSGWPA